MVSEVKQPRWVYIRDRDELWCRALIATLDLSDVSRVLNQFTDLCRERAEAKRREWEEAQVRIP